jgi:RNA polymerase sigma-70 factor (ECF subfamily)
MTMTHAESLHPLSPRVESVPPVESRVEQVELVFRELVTQHKERLYRFVLKHIGHSTEAEDLAQQAFVEAARTFETFRGESQLSTWLYGIAMNLVRNHLSRAPQRLYRFEDESALDDTASDMADPCEHLEMTQMVRLLDNELAELMPEMREVLLLVALDDMSYEEAAELLSVPIGTVRSRVSRARAQLRRRFEAAGAALPF